MRLLHTRKVGSTVIRLLGAEREGGSWTVIALEVEGKTEHGGYTTSICLSLAERQALLRFLQGS